MIDLCHPTVQVVSEDLIKVFTMRSVSEYVVQSSDRPGIIRRMLVAQCSAQARIAGGEPRENHLTESV